MNDSEQSGLQVIFLSHGGGPLPLLGDPGHTEMVNVFQQMGKEVRRPQTIVVISAHWEEPVATITSGETPGLIYDYFGFPEEAYRVRYDAPGHPLLAEKLRNLLHKSGITARLDGQRGFDHGLFVPLNLLFKEADIPCIQLSLLENLSPDEHIRMGMALREMSSENVLVVGSGFSFHNLPEFFASPTDDTRAKNIAFDDWLVDVCSNSELGGDERLQRLRNWEAAPSARYCHPREEHLLPLHVCLGLSSGPASKVYRFEVMQRRAINVIWR